jgi:hypothetical protein
MAHASLCVRRDGSPSRSGARKERMMEQPDAAVYILNAEETQQWQALRLPE